MSDRHIIIKNILDYGSSESTMWLRSTYSSEDIRAVIESTPISDWGKKSLSLWSLIYGTSPRSTQRAIV